MSDEISIKHWYDRNGVPCHGVPTKEAKARGLYPSVTEVLKVIRAPFLERWFLEQALGVAHKNRNSLLSEDAFVDFCVNESWKVVRAAADAGKGIHAAVEGEIKGEAKPTDHTLHQAVSAWNNYRIDNLRSVMSSETTFADDVYQIGGTIDLIAEHKEHGIAILDIKTQDFGKSGKPKFHKHYTYQLAAYARCYARRMGLKEDPRIITLAYPRNDPFARFYEKVWSKAIQESSLNVFECARNLHAALST